MMQKFPSEVHDQLGWYVYRLVDPRNGHTFYVGKGKGDRVFQHANGALKPNEDEEKDLMTDLKIDTIRAIKRDNQKVIELIHRHGIETGAIAFEIEAALIDAYPGLTNLVGGHASAQNGCRTVHQIVEAYAAKELVPEEPLILIFIGRALDEGRDVYNAVRAAWRMSKGNAEKYKLVLAYDVSGIVRGAYRPERWFPATQLNFPFLPHDLPKRIGFVGTEANDVKDRYLGRKVPPRPKGSMTPFRYIGDEKIGVAEQRAP
jgi:hypothetical protein